MNVWDIKELRASWEVEDGCLNWDIIKDTIIYEKLQTLKKVLELIEECRVILITPRKKQDYINGVNDFMIKLRGEIQGE